MSAILVLLLPRFGPGLRKTRLEVPECHGDFIRKRAGGEA